MQTMLRAAIMLAVLVGLPAAWVYYGPLPPQAQAAVDRVVATAKEAVEWDRWMVAAESRVAPPPNLPFRTVSAVAPPAQPAATPPSPPPVASLADRVEPLLAQLRGWGATEYRLEPWGDGRRHFRFSCAMPIVEGATATQLFEAVADNPLESVERVAADVAAWRTASMTAMR
jgi:hypothetical protein